MLKIASRPVPRVTLWLAAGALFGAAVPVSAQTAPPVRRTASAPRTILFIGNSFTQGAVSPVQTFRTGSVTDLNGTGIGGVPALFKAFTEQVGLNFSVAHETQGGRTLGFHLTERADRIDRAWDTVVLQEYSTLNPERPGDASAYISDAGTLAALFVRTNPRVQVFLMPTWSRADLVYRPGSPWSGLPIGKMADDVQHQANVARAASREIAGVIPVGRAWNIAIAKGAADPNPYDGITAGQMNLWAVDHYHASSAGYYLEALTVFGRVTGLDPRSLGAREPAAEELGLTSAQSLALQTAAADALGLTR